MNLKHLVCSSRVCSSIQQVQIVLRFEAFIYANHTLSSILLVLSPIKVHMRVILFCFCWGDAATLQASIDPYRPRQGWLVRGGDAVFMKFYLLFLLNRLVLLVHCNKLKFVMWELPRIQETLNKSKRSICRTKVSWMMHSLNVLACWYRVHRA